MSREAKLTELVDRTLLAAGTTGERQVWFTRPEAASAVRKTLTDAETVYKRVCEGLIRHGAEMNQRAMRAEAALREIAELAHDKSTGPAVPDALWDVRRMAYDAIGAAS